jgi:hypothetical protein
MVGACAHTPTSGPQKVMVIPNIGDIIGLPYMVAQDDDGNIKVDLHGNQRTYSPRSTLVTSTSSTTKNLEFFVSCIEKIACTVIKGLVGDQLIIPLHDRKHLHFAQYFAPSTLIDLLCGCLHQTELHR